MLQSISSSHSLTHTQTHTKTPFLLFHTQIATSKCSTEKPETFFCKVPLSRLSGPQAAELKASRVNNTVQHPLTLACICFTAASTENSIQIFIYILESHTISRTHSQLENCFSGENWWIPGLMTEFKKRRQKTHVTFTLIEVVSFNSLW